MLNKELCLVAIVLISTVALFTIAGGQAEQRDGTICPDASGRKMKVVRVIDGDTVDAVDELGGAAVRRLRLYGIDAPESGQAFSNVARSELNRIVYGQVVKVIPCANDKYGRLVARVMLLDANEGQPQSENEVATIMLRKGLAWWFERYAAGMKNYGAAELEGKNAKRGLWSEAAPEPPWEYRRTEWKRKESTRKESMRKE